MAFELLIKLRRTKDVLLFFKTIGLLFKVKIFYNYTNI